VRAAGAIAHQVAHDLIDADAFAGRADETEEALRFAVREDLGSDLAARMFGGGFGTGEYLMFGALYADINRLTLVEDRNAEPIVQNIDIGTD
ncbi:MAG: hypothetical protein AAFO62_04805, partial [Pseudomonadota bacterium]